MELSLAKYVEIEESSKFFLLDKNYDYTSDKSSKPIPMMVLYEKWNALTLDFQNKLDSNSMKDLYAYKSKSMFYKQKYDLAIKMIDVMSIGFNEDIAQLLFQLGIPIENKEKKEQYDKEIKRARVSAKSILSESTEASNILIELDKKAQSNKVIDNKDDNENTWLKILINLGIANQCHYKPSEVSCYEFLELYKIALKNSKKK